MIVCDLTHAYTPTSGGIRTYIDAKRDYLLNHTSHEHVLVVPGPRDEVDRGERWTTHRIRAPLIPGAAPYRFFVRPSKIVAALRASAPDVVELNSWYLEPWSAFRYRDEARNTIVSGYFFTDVSEAYVGAPLRKRIGSWAARPAQALAETYMRRIFARCDLACAPSPKQAARLSGMDITPAHVVTPGVNVDTFHPKRADDAVRTRLGVARDHLLLVYAGRFDAEKRVHVMVEAVRRVNRDRPATLLMIGDGPLRGSLQAQAKNGTPIRVLDYVKDRSALARWMASSDLYLTAGPHETFAFSVVEAQACGLPVVGVAAGALTERVQPGLGRLGPVDDASAMADNILAVADECAAMGETARRHVEAQYSWKTTFDGLLDLYETALYASAS